MIKNETVLQSYLTYGLEPIVRALAGERAMGIWEIINEPEGCMLPGESFLIVFILLYVCLTFLHVLTGF